jgi:hypothetical protein
MPYASVPWKKFQRGLGGAARGDRRCFADLIGAFCLSHFGIVKQLEASPDREFSAC